jgi:hypothetical protein
MTDAITKISKRNILHFQICILQITRNTTKLLSSSKGTVVMRQWHLTAVLKIIQILCFL